jgi:DNA-binding NarL/FixJ family response regulator
LKVLIVDDDASIRDKLTVALLLEQDFEVIGTAVNGHEAFLKCQEQKPDLVLMDLRMPVADGVLGTELIKSNYRDVNILILTALKSDEYIKEAMKKGADGCILKNMPSDSIVKSIREICALK